MKFAKSMALLILDQSAPRRLVFGPPSNPGGPQDRGKKKPGTSDDQQKVQRRVLVVEDNLDSLHSLVALLRSEGHKVEYAINGYAAMTIAEEFQPEVVLLDLGLPGVDGYQVARWLKVQPGLEASRIIAITGYGTKADRAKSNQTTRARSPSASTALNGFRLPGGRKEPLGGRLSACRKPP